ncbi:phosphoinositide phosphatase SAC8 isoform X2 [Phalaenopsis equestris]|uniref:phosphoinositide phosphatase SAC8 isoform X2 n=1 Tax=Phalaenopsis equestris TaxID=78828 RepID=UPI0009E2501C|nr:phosphoinositide phosphatase SAC8 isoform X2 [Phalaenopsis equestris]
MKGGEGSGEVGLQQGFCCRELELREFPDKYVIRSLDPSLPDQAFAVSRSDGGIKSLTGDAISESPSKVSQIFGVVGILRLISGTYILVITSREEIGTYFDSPIYSAKSMRFLSCHKAWRTSQEKRDEGYFMSLLRIVESTPGLYYSYELDLTLNLQRSCKLDEVRLSKPLWKQADPRYIWNKTLLEDLIEHKLDAFIIPIIQGSFRTIDFTLKHLPAKISLISRRCNRRLGTRMWRRGANLEGDTANFIETEQLLELEGFKFSFLQVRGSIPLLWEQIVDLSYKPRLRIIGHGETAKVVERHFNDLIQRYGNIVVLDLTDEHGDEGQLSCAYAAEMEKLSHVRYVSFDFHCHCAKGRLDNLKILYDEISEDFQKQGYFLINSEGVILQEQRGVTRANCIDCLDRTNVTQCYLARKSLNSQLQKIGAFSSTDCISLYVDIDEAFKMLWAEHGDEISLEYTGTHALKGDLVRYGKQTMSGWIKDGITALSRYYLNNFQDGLRQDALDLISGRYDANRTGPPFQLKDSFSYVPVASALIIGGLTVTSFSLNQGRPPQNFLSSVLLAGLAAGVMAAVKANGRQFCSRPRLCGPF